MVFREIPPFPTGLQENPTHVGHALISSGDFLLHHDSWGLFRNSSWSASSPLQFTWYLIDAVSSFGPSLILCTICVAQKFGPPFFLLHYLQFYATGFLSHMPYLLTWAG